MKRNIICLTVLAVILVGCTTKHNKQADEAHHHDENLQLTAYSNNFEVYAEAEPFVVGQASDILAHFSHLNNFKPLEGGDITATLVVGNDRNKQLTTTPQKAGIYKFKITPQKAGKGEVIFEIGDERVIVHNVTVYADKHEAEHAAADAVASSSNGAVYTKEQSWKADFATEKSRLDKVGAKINAVGRVLVKPSQKESVNAKSRGVAYFVKKDLVIGSYVQKGEVLANVVSSSMAENNMSVKLRETKANYELAAQEYKRKKSLAKDKIVSKAELQQAKNDYVIAETAYDNLTKNFTAKGEKIVAPISGYIASISLKNGDIVDSGTELFTLSQNDNIYITAHISPKYHSVLDKIADVIFTEQSSGKSYTMQALSGEVVGYGRELADGATLIPVTFAIDNKKAKLLAGSFVNVDITTEGDNDVVTVPHASLIEEMGNFFVYKQLTPEFFEKTPVTVGLSNPLRVEIKSGLKAGERVVSRGAILVKLAQSAGALDPHAGHSH